jgi:hypothetical protein
MGMDSMQRRPLRVSGTGPSKACIVCRSTAAAQQDSRQQDKDTQGHVDLQGPLNH